MNETRKKPTTRTGSPTLFNKWHRIFYMPDTYRYSWTYQSPWLPSHGSLGGTQSGQFPMRGRLSTVAHANHQTTRTPPPPQLKAPSSSCPLPAPGLLRDTFGKTPARVVRCNLLGGTVPSTGLTGCQVVSPTRSKVLPWASIEWFHLRVSASDSHQPGDPHGNIHEINTWKCPIQTVWLGYI